MLSLPRGLMEFLKWLSLHLDKISGGVQVAGEAVEAGNGVNFLLATVDLFGMISSGLTISQRVPSLPSGQEFPDCRQWHTPRHGESPSPTCSAAQHTAQHKPALINDHVIRREFDVTYCITAKIRQSNLIFPQPR